jgi:hypothetical protein
VRYGTEEKSGRGDGRKRYWRQDIRRDRRIIITAMKQMKRGDMRQMRIGTSHR